MVRSLLSATYSWPKSRDITVERYGNKGGVSLGLLCNPHANEPLGSAVVSCLSQLLTGGEAVTVFGGIELPPQEKQYPLPCTFHEFLETFWLPPIAEQVEFSHCDKAETSSQHRAAQLRELIIRERVSAILLLHNDPFARHPYLYANHVYPDLEKTIETAVGDYFSFSLLPPVAWTKRLSRLTYAYFETERILPECMTEPAGRYIPKRFGIPVLTLELPMFDWSGCSDEFVELLRDAYFCAWNRPSMNRTTVPSLTEHSTVQMISPAVNAMVSWAATKFLLTQ